MTCLCRVLYIEMRMCAYVGCCPACDEAQGSNEKKAKNENPHLLQSIASPDSRRCCFFVFVGSRRQEMRPPCSLALSALYALLFFLFVHMMDAPQDTLPLLLPLVYIQSSIPKSDPEPLVSPSVHIHLTHVPRRAAYKTRPRRNMYKIRPSAPRATAPPSHPRHTRPRPPRRRPPRAAGPTTGRPSPPPTRHPRPPRPRRQPRPT